MVSLKRFSKYEKKEMIANLIKKYTLGLTTAQITSIMRSMEHITEVLKELEEEKRIRKIKIGNAYLYKENKEVKSER